MPSQRSGSSLNGRSASDVLLPSELAAYERTMEFFFGELVTLSVNLYITDKVLAFPIDALTAHIADQKIFLGHVVDNFLDVSLLIVTRVAADTDAQVYTLPQLKNDLKERMARPEYRQALRRRFTTANFDETTRNLLAMAQRLRNNRIAHVNRAYVLGHSGSALVGQVKELKTLRDELNRLYNSLLFGVEALMLPLSYEDGHADIDDFLDAYARSSPLLKMPEEEPAAWEHAHTYLSQADMEAINQYRAKLFHLPPVSLMVASEG